LHQLHPLAREISHLPSLSRVNVAFQQYPETQQLGQMSGISKVASVFQPFVLPDRRGVGQMHMVTILYQLIHHQPLPVVCRFDDHSHQIFTVRCRSGPDLYRIVR
jgi:hypothetical protein